ncbi:hypothetical protein SSX86_010042 [Deinandra increscens subsp. villosa]|uniref:F-box/LRR-repeat protein 15/At3g58940/PEG3-like LRR domain-containing protein n=1 Tax=Deinandra increscens subsp. villosa TaxID=3103831 RepID=A0AAP0H1L8_9ASTR
MKETEARFLVFLGITDNLLIFRSSSSPNQKKGFRSIICCKLTEMETLASQTIGDADRISHLPESIIHSILDYIHPSHGPPIDIVRMSVLSKTWLNLTASFPILYFIIDDFSSRESFFKYVEYTTSRFCLQNVPAQKLTLMATMSNPAEITTIYQSLELLLQKGVQGLVIDITFPDYSSPSNPFPMPKYCLPDILLSVSVLKYLIIRHTALPSSLMVDDIKFKSLIQLILCDVPVDDEMIKYLAKSCPLLQDLKVLSCDGYQNFCVNGHRNLQQVGIDYNTTLERIDIEAPNLSHLWIQDLDDRGPPRMNLGSCKKLTAVTYYGYYLPNDFLSNFPFIEYLHLITYDTLNNLKWSSRSLRALVLQCDCDLEEIEFNTPNLFVFVYGSLPPNFFEKRRPLSRHSTNLKSCMRCYPDGWIDAYWFQMLRLFFEKKNGFKPLNLYIQTNQKSIELEDLNAIELPPYQLQYVELQLDTHEEPSAHMAFVDAVLWCCRPRFLTLRSSFPVTDSQGVIKYICDKLLQQEDQGRTSIQFVSRDEGKTIGFMKKDGIQQQAKEQSKV